MLRRLATLTVFLALMVGVLACTSIPETVDEIPRITVEELKAELDKGSVTVIDTRGTMSYEILHMPGALDIPEQDIRSRVGELPRDGLIVTYCT